MLRTWYPKFYPRATQNRHHGKDQEVVGLRKGFFKAAMINFLMLQLLFLALFSYVFGSIWQQNPHIHNMKVVFVDYDGGLVGKAVRQAYVDLKGDRFPTLEEQSAAQYPTPTDLRSAVCGRKYWAAFYISPGATSRLEDALAGGASATSYNRSDAMTYIWNEAIYPAVSDSAISANLQALATTARVAYTAINGTGALQVLSPTDAAAISVFGNPWQLATVNIQPTIQGSRLIYNTIVIILVLIQEFFYLGTINALYVQFNIYANLYPIRIIIFRNMISLAYTFIGSLCTTGAIWAFRSPWKVNGNQFVLSWMTLWLFAHANFLSLDVVTVWFPVPYVPMGLITWIIFNVSSILVPFDLSPGFYKWAYVMPAHEVYQILADIWSGGCNPELHYALPILFALEVTGLILSGLGVYRRCHYAILGKEAQEKIFQERVDAAMEFERKRLPKTAEAQENEVNGEGAEGAEGAELKERTALAEAIREEDAEVALERAKSRTFSFGPSFAPAVWGD